MSSGYHPAMTTSPPNRRSIKNVDDRAVHAPCENPTTTTRSAGIPARVSASMRRRMCPALRSASVVSPCMRRSPCVDTSFRSNASRSRPAFGRVCPDTASQSDSASRVACSGMRLRSSFVTRRSTDDHDWARPLTLPGTGRMGAIAETILTHGRLMFSPMNVPRPAPSAPKPCIKISVAVCSSGAGTTRGSGKGWRPCHLAEFFIELVSTSSFFRFPIVSPCPFPASASDFICKAQIATPPGSAGQLAFEAQLRTWGAAGRHAPQVRDVPPEAGMENGAVGRNVAKTKHSSRRWHLQVRRIPSEL
mmetsp:Transcript_30809/g.71972  ORF Transcript_30809/g.71972 Transcript_30809/m.71972 type:complete len:305 (+) Transcript_30809:335-1249(+)